MKSKLLSIFIIVSIMLSLVACGKKGNQVVNPQSQNKSTEEQQNKSSNKEIIKLYFPDDNAEYVLEEKREIESPDTMKVLKELQKGSTERNMKFMFSEDINIKSVSVEDKVAIIDFDDSINGKIAGTAGESLTIASISNSLILNEKLGIEKIKFTQNGNVMESLGGHVDTSQPLGASKDSIKK